jgi:hypothetical protein
MTTDTSGFYRVDQNDMFQYAPNFVHGPDYSLLKIEHASYTYPTTGGWMWFDDEATARTHFNVPAPVDELDIPPWLARK